MYLSNGTKCIRHKRLCLYRSWYIIKVVVLIYAYLNFIYALSIWYVYLHKFYMLQPIKGTAQNIIESQMTMIVMSGKI